MRLKLTNWMALPLLAVGAVVPMLLDGQTEIPATVVFDDSATKRIRSDGLSLTYGNYPHLINCVTDRVGGGGLYFLRTVTLSCVDPPIQRGVVLDFTDREDDQSCDPVDDAFGQAGTLDPCGPNLIVDIRFIADKAFAGNAFTNGTSLTIPFSLQRDFSRTAFHLKFESKIRVTAGPNSNVRVLTASGSNAIAELYKTENNKQQTLTSLGHYSVPFQATVTRIP